MTSRVLVVDDSPVYRLLCTEALAGDYTVDEAKSGEEGLEACAKVGYDLIVTDVIMDGIDGWEFVRRLRSTRRHAMTPVIFMTALAAPPDRLKGFQLGADGYVTKPVDSDELNVLARNAIERAAAMHAGLRPADGSASPAGTVAGLHGRLSEMGLGTLLTMLEMEQKTGTLLVSATGHATMHLAVRDGRVVQVVAEDGSVPGPAVEQLADLLGLSDGTFAFEAGQMDHVEDEVGSSTSQLLMLAAQHVDENAAGS